MLHDYYVPFMREEEIARIAMKWRHAGNISNVAYFNIVEFIENVLADRLSQRKGSLIFNISTLPSNRYPAYVTFNPTTLHVDSEVWDLAKIGEPERRFYLAHEVGHIVLHDHYAVGFSNDVSHNIRFALQEHSAEWQANTFAKYFLLPDHIVRSIGDVQRITQSCMVLRQLAQDRMLETEKANRRNKTFTGDACSRCGNFTLVRNGINSKCDTCGTTTGCS